MKSQSSEIRPRNPNIAMALDNAIADKILALSARRIPIRSLPLKINLKRKARN